MNKKTFKRWWSKPHIRDNNRLGYGSFSTVYHYFKMNDEEEFFSFTRMTAVQFTYVFTLVEDRLRKRSRRAPLPPELRFVIVLKYVYLFYIIYSSTLF